MARPLYTVAQIEIPAFLEETVAEIVAFLPRLVGALLVLLVGWAVGVAVGSAVRSLSDRVGLDTMTMDTPLGRIMGGSRRAVSSTFGALAKWFVYALAILAAANVLAIDLLSQWIQTAVSYLPAFIAGLAVIVLGFVVADFIGDAIMRTRAATETDYTSWFAAGTRMFLYFTAIVIGLDTMGIDVGILYLFAEAFAWGLAAAVAIGAGVAFGWGGHSYVSENIDRWMGTARSATPEPSGSAATDGGTVTDGGCETPAPTDPSASEGRDGD
ncbi:mechanosensitive ion channel family protein [Halosimplex marinum]|uniref:mechanosensitive ion channel family protein n=1 Tax=Halosimplex marinum TaxID=3396620 RepID=UPI003F56EB03